MEDLEEIEGSYQNALEKEDEAFLKKLNDPSNKGKRKILEKEYNEKLKALFEEYNKNVAGFLKRKDVKLFEKNETPEDENKEKKPTGPFKVKKFDLNPGYKEKSNVRWKVFKFNFKVSFKDFTRKFIPASAVIFFLTVKLEIINAYIELKSFFTNIFRAVFVRVKFFLMKIKSFFVGIFSAVKKFSKVVIGKILFFRKKNKDEDGKEKKDSKELKKGETSKESK